MVPVGVFKHVFRTIEEVPYRTARTSLRSPVHVPGVHRSNDESTKFDESPPHSPDAEKGMNKEYTANARNAQNGRNATRESQKLPVLPD